MAISTFTDSQTDVDSAGEISDDLVASYRENGFVRVRGILSAQEADRFRANAESLLASHSSESVEKSNVFVQLVNVWRQDATARDLTWNPRIARVAEQLAGIPLRLWHDQMLVKEPHNDAATEFHQDRPFWPHQDDRHSLSAWIALVDVPPERGCMTFLPGTQDVRDLRPQDLHDSEDLFTADPSLRWRPRVTIPLRAGDCTFHNGYTGHMALPNHTDQARLAHVNIYIDINTRYSGTPHPTADQLGLEVGTLLDGDQFPRPWA